MPQKRILFVDDDEDTRLAMVALLGLSGYEVMTAPDVSEGLALAQIGRYDLYLLDQKFPAGNGLELCRQIRQFDSQTPILFWSALAREADQRVAIAAGAQGYLEKPADLEDLEQAIARVLN